MRKLSIEKAFRVSAFCFGRKTCFGLVGGRRPKIPVSVKMPRAWQARTVADRDYKWAENVDESALLMIGTDLCLPPRS